jgi:Tol biopolymer transport system component
VTEDIELRDMLRATAEKASLPSVMPQPMRQKVTQRRARTIGITFVMTVAIAVGGLQGMRAITLDEAATRPKETQPAGAVPEVDYVIDLKTGEMTPLPEAIIRSLDETGRERSVRGLDSGQYAASPDGSSLAFVGAGDEGSPQIFVAGKALELGRPYPLARPRSPRDGTGLRQVTHDPRRATSPAWSPDGTKIAYDDGRSIFVVDVATGESRQLTYEPSQCPLCTTANPQFTPDGSSIIYTGGTGLAPGVRTVPVTGGTPTLLFDLEAGNGKPLLDAGNGSLSPDGSLVTFLGSEEGEGGPIRFVANADGTDRRAIPGHASNPAGAWSPDGSRIVVTGDTSGGLPGIRVVDIATGVSSVVAEGRWAIWLDDHTLLVEV